MPPTSQDQGFEYKRMKKRGIALEILLLNACVVRSFREVSKKKCVLSHLLLVIEGLEKNMCKLEELLERWVYPHHLVWMSTF